MPMPDTASVIGNVVVISNTTKKNKERKLRKQTIVSNMSPESKSEMLPVAGADLKRFFSIKQF